MDDGMIKALQLASSKGAPMNATDAAYAVPGKGLKGDRYFSQPQTRRSAAVTLIESEALDALAAEYGIRLPFNATRRNLLTRGLSLNQLVGQAFWVGEVLLRGTALCEPCWHIAQSQPQVLRGLLHRGGLRAEVLSEGTIVVGTAIKPRLPVPISNGRTRRRVEKPY